MIVPREQVFAALFSLVSGATIGGGQAFVTTSRRVIPWTMAQNVEQPALFQLQGNQKASQQKAIGLTRWELHASLWIYNKFPGDPTALPSTPLNTLIDAVDSALQTKPPGELQTLGGLITHCFIDGEIVIDEGVLGNQNQSVAVIPVTLIVGS